ncbi:hypothetical protein Fmac_003071 [Flemingia macrophylla]|uniref:Uncharacterized protein n=1 Tax=Flemingia macrophylla TaxID=520843 RepID=A0ABD1NLV3_9FABA
MQVYLLKKYMLTEHRHQNSLSDVHQCVRLYENGATKISYPRFPLLYLPS